uniref:TFIIS-type domain-containing protein n=1 Tax=Chromera velia CCMP2878 TaxID=1169474 RepID=A0A0G4HA18_9ALVE|mmetsp:Transcript_39020/g.76754  ORF Transcript_39020/g.76754 Transcript_39020/m.76754 type:complete len:176 (-) Transcript_39020:130-657(-)|eukprot:Cvel_5989.t1-p1 / transcript=Cvel_5989.t1 / gene=Cvel_5989 / organism=Chromera_velia_CCMP2878 / gene_product=DNA-directed RNA polymerase II subunit RPB9, putative / transcript_product=DNA-directed RNA polymerase II subunit RPB9, putative / location=Cvel_scaffold287:1778-3383(-) / protein_length=175 / sequence_SO=supercontig / SO=protein_coding / is_pseudo=false
MSDIRFCNECNNLLYPRESRAEKQLRYECKSCGMDRPAAPDDVGENTVFRRVIMATAEQDHSVINPEIVEDPTLPRSTNFTCKHCRHRQAVFFQMQTTRSEDAMKLLFVCTNCRKSQPQDSQDNLDKRQHGAEGEESAPAAAAAASSGAEPAAAAAADGAPPARKVRRSEGEVPT